MVSQMAIITPKITSSNGKLAISVCYLVLLSSLSDSQLSSNMLLLLGVQQVPKGLSFTTFTALSGWSGV